MLGTISPICRHARPRRGFPWLRLQSAEVRSIDILCVAVQTTDETLLTYLVIYVGMIVRWACTDAFEFGNANPDLRET